MEKSVIKSITIHFEDEHKPTILFKNNNKFKRFILKLTGATNVTLHYTFKDDE